MISNTCAQGESNNESIVLLDKHIIGIPWQSSVSNAGSTSSILGLGTKIPHLMAQEKKKNCHSSHMKKTTTVNFYIFKNVWLLHHALYTKYNKKAKNVYIKIWSMLSHNIYGFICWWMHPKFCESFKKHFKQYLALWFCMLMDASKVLWIL